MYTAVPIAIGVMKGVGMHVITGLKHANETPAAILVGVVEIAGLASDASASDDTQSVIAANFLNMLFFPGNS